LVVSANNRYPFILTLGDIDEYTSVTR